MASMLSTIVFGLFIASVAECACPDGWVTHGINCYFFSHDSEDWPGATQMCTLAGGTLVEIESPTEGHYLSSQAGIYQGNFWIALTDIQVEGEWKWSNSKEALNKTIYSHWMKGQPDNHSHNQNCVYIDGDSGRWADGTCHNALKYICEKISGDAGIIIG